MWNSYDCAANILMTFYVEDRKFAESFQCFGNDLYPHSHRQNLAFILARFGFIYNDVCELTDTFLGYHSSRSENKYENQFELLSGKPFQTKKKSFFKHEKQRKLTGYVGLRSY